MLLLFVTLTKRLSWEAGNYSFFWGKSLDYGYKHRLGTKLTYREQRALQTDESPFIESYDFRNEEYILNSPRKNRIRDQGECGASWAFSTIGISISFKINIIFLKPNIKN